MKRFAVWFTCAIGWALGSGGTFAADSATDPAEGAQPDAEPPAAAPVETPDPADGDAAPAAINTPADADGGAGEAGDVAPVPAAPAAGALPVEPKKPANPTNPYFSIVARNPFGLKPEPPPPEPPPVQPPVTASALKLTGITTLLGGKRAMFVVQEPGKTNLVSDLVREGDWDTYITNLQVLTIDERLGAVRVVYGGKELALNFEDNGIKPPTTPVPGAPGTPAGRGAAGGPMRIAPVAVPPPGMAGGINSAVPTVVPAPSSRSSGSGLRRIPSRPSRLGGGLATPTASLGQNPDFPPLTTEQQILSMKAQEEIARQQGVILPPTPPVPGIDFPAIPGGGSVPPVPGGIPQPPQ